MTLAPGTEERRRTVNGLEHRWLERGDGPRSCWCTAFPTSAELWRHVMPLVEGARLLAWEMPGYGRSWDVPADADISVGAQADRLLGWLTRSEPDRV